VRIGSEIAVRTSALLGSFLVGLGGARPDRRAVARRPPDRLPLFIFRAHVLTRFAVAAQILVGRMLAPETRTPPGPRGAARSSGPSWPAPGLGVVLLALGGLIPRAFTSDPAVIERPARSGRCRGDDAAATARSSRSTASSSARATRAF
jgi:hypothetical protein